MAHLLCAMNISYQTSVYLDAMNKRLLGERHKIAAKLISDLDMHYKKMTYIPLNTNNNDAADKAEKSQQESSRDETINKIKKELQKAMRLKVNKLLKLRIETYSGKL